MLPSVRLIVFFLSTIASGTVVASGQMAQGYADCLKRRLLARRARLESGDGAGRGRVNLSLLGEHFIMTILLWKTMQLMKEDNMSKGGRAKDEENQSDNQRNEDDSSDYRNNVL